MGKVPEYTKKAIKNYDSKYDKVLVRFPAGIADIIRTQLNTSCNAYIVQLVLDDLKSKGLLDGFQDETKLE